MTFLDVGPPVPWWKRILRRWRDRWRWWRLMRRGMPMPMVKRPFPGLAVDDIVGVQPMTNTDTRDVEHFFQRVESKLPGEEDFN